MEDKGKRRGLTSKEGVESNGGQRGKANEDWECFCQRQMDSSHTQHRRCEREPA